MRVVHVACIHDTQFGGVSNVVPQVLNRQKKYADIAFVNIIDEKIQSDCVQSVYQGKGTFLRSIEASFKRPDLVVFHEIYIYQYLQIAKELTANNIPYIIVPHGCLTKQAQANKKVKKILGNALLFNKFIDGAEVIQYLSKNEQERSIRQKKFSVCGNGIDIPDESKRFKKKNSIVITYIGRIEIVIKGFDLLINAVKGKRALLVNNNATINIYGPENQGKREELKKMIADNNLQDLIVVHKEVSGEEKKKVLLDSDIFIQTSRTEGMPMGIIEAMAYGLPCLVTKGTSFGDIIRTNNAGWVADVNAESIGNCLDAALSEITSASEKGHNARTYAISHFEWESVTNDTLELYKNVLRKSGRLCCEQ